MSFAHPTWLFALLALPLVALWMGWVWSVRRKRLARYADPKFWPTVAGDVSWTKKRVKYALRLGALAFLIIAAARPQWGIKERPLVREGSDIFICLDVSTSMLARDIAPTRLASAKQQIRSLIYNLKGDRVGLVLFAGDAFVQCPLTLDYGLAVDLLEAANPDSVSLQGTRIGVAIDTARKAFDRSALGTKSIILVTDGEDQGSHPIEAAKRAAKDGVVIECVGIGTTSGVPILLPNGNYKEDRQGRKVTSRLDVDTLKKIALATGGKAVVTGASGNMDLEALYKEIKRYERRRIDTQEVTLLEDRFQWPLGAALLLLAAELFLSDRARRSGGSRRRRLRLRRAARNAAGGAVAIAFLLLAPRPAAAAGWEFGNRAARLCQQGNQALQQGDLDAALAKYHDAQVIAPDNAVLDYNIGVALARQKKWAEARDAFNDAARKAHTDTDLRSKAHYNAAIADFESAQGLSKQKELEKAIQSVGHSIDANQKALDIEPDFGDAKQNLNEARDLLKKLVEQKKTAQQQQKQQQGDKKKDQEKQGQKEQQQNQQQKNDENKEQQKNSGQSQNKDQKGEQQKGQKGEQKKQEGQQGKNTASPSPTATPTPTNEQGKSKEEQEKEQKEQKAKPGENEQQAGQGEEQKDQARQAMIGKMTKEDAQRLLSTLPDENPQALQKALQAQQGGSVRLEKDW